jgi:hypothetical protein
MYTKLADRNSSQLRHYERRRDYMIKYLGSKCTDCGSILNLELDHIDRKQKAFNISKCYSFSLEKLLPELDKCCLRCHTCHARKTKEVDGIQAKHGSLGMYRHQKCRCLVCKAANAAYMREYKKRKVVSAGE